MAQRTRTPTPRSTPPASTRLLTPPAYSSTVQPARPLCHTQVQDAIIAQGAIISEATISNAVIGLRATIGQGCVIQDAMVMGADYFESDTQLAEVRICGSV